MNEKAEITKVELVIGGNPISLTPDQARDLQRVLNELFREPVQGQTVPASPVVVPIPYPAPVRPAFWPWEITWCGDIATIKGPLTLHA